MPFSVPESHLDFSTPFLIPSIKVLSQAIDEMNKVELYKEAKPADDGSGLWDHVTITLMSTTCHNVYNGMEQVMKAVCKNVDGYLPTGDSSHQEILDQVMTARHGIRPAIMPDDFYADMKELKGFRHVANHNYVVTLDMQRTTVDCH